MHRPRNAMVALTALALTAMVAGVPTQSVEAQGVETVPLPDPQLPAPNATIPEQTFPCNPGGYEPPEGREQADLRHTFECDEVIEPPPGIDPEIKIQPPDPDPGEMPIIPPSAVEPQT